MNSPVNCVSNTLVLFLSKILLLSLCVLSNEECYEEGSCSDTTISGSHDEVIDCGGYVSCNNARVEQFGNVNCNGAKSCDDSKIYQTNLVGGINIDCSGWKSCENTTTTNIRTINCNGHQSCRFNDVIDNARNGVYCHGYQSCEGQAINDTDYAACVGHRSCGASFISNIEELHCGSSQACRKSQISNVGLLRCTGVSGCKTANITDATRIRVDGFKTLYGASIRLEKMNEVTVVASGYLATKNAQLYCNSGETCQVDCLDNYACSGLEIHAHENSTVLVNCNYNSEYNETYEGECSYYCPTVYSSSSGPPPSTKKSTFASQILSGISKHWALLAVSGVILMTFFISVYFGMIHVPCLTSCSFTLDNNNNNEYEQIIDYTDLIDTRVNYAYNTYGTALYGAIASTINSISSTSITKPSKPLLLRILYISGVLSVIGLLFYFVSNPFKLSNYDNISAHHSTPKNVAKIVEFHSKEVNIDIDIDEDLPDGLDNTLLTKTAVDFFLIDALDEEIDEDLSSLHFINPHKKEKKNKQTKSSLKCNEYQECQDSSLFTNTKGFFCGGYEACSGITVDSVRRAHCAGELSCTSSTFTGVADGEPKISCTGKKSCNSVTYNSGNDSSVIIRCSGDESCTDSTFDATDGTVICTGRLGCQSTSIENADEVLSSGYSSSISSLIDTNYAFCGGYKSCAESRITSDGEIDCDGEYSCQNSALHAKESYYPNSTISINGVGSYALRGAVIDSEHVPSLTVELYGYYSTQNATIECRQNSYCSIGCYTTYACSDLQVNIYTGSSYDIDCDEDCYECPMVSFETDDNNDNNNNKDDDDNNNRDDRNNGQVGTTEYNDYDLYSTGTGENGSYNKGGNVWKVIGFVSCVWFAWYGY